MRGKHALLQPAEALGLSYEPVQWCFSVSGGMGRCLPQALGPLEQRMWRVSLRNLGQPSTGLTHSNSQ